MIFSMASSVGQKATEEKPPRIPYAIALDALWVIDEKKKLYGLNAVGIKRAVTESAVRQLDKDRSSLTMVDAKGAIQIPAHLIPILNRTRTKPATWVLDSQLVKPNFKTTTIAHRPRFDEWSMVVPVMWNMSKLTKEDVLKLFRDAGFQGVGCHRNEKNGTNGMFEVGGAKNFRIVAQ